MNKKELIRRALMGDEKAQEECTNRAIILPCPFCGGEAALVEEAGLYSICCKDGTCIGSDIHPEYGELICAIADWNTRPAPPIGRCGECRHSYINFFSASSGTALCRLWTNKAEGAQMAMQQNDFCSYFEPKEEE